MKSFVLALWLSLQALLAQATLLTPASREVNLLDHAQFLEDPTGRLGLDEVKAMGERFQPWSGKGTEMNFGFTDSAFWVRVPLQREANAPEDWLLEVHYARLLELDFYPSQGAPVLTGSARPFDTRPYYDRLYVLPLRVGTEPGFVYLRLTSRYAMTVPLTLWAPDSFRQRQHWFQALQFTYHGALLVLGLYGLLIFLALRDRRFLVFAAYIASVSLGMFASNGYGRQMLWPHSPAFDEMAQNFFYSLSGLTMIELATALLLPTSGPSWMRRTLRLSQLSFTLSSLFSLMHLLWPVWQSASNQLLMLNAVLMGLLVTVAGIQAWRQKRPGVRFFVMGWTAIWLGACVATLRAFDWLPSTGLTSYALQLSTVVETLLVAMALADILHMEQQAHQTMQAQAFASQQALLELSQTGEEKLKKAVRERTAQLEGALRSEKDLREQYVRFGSMVSHEFRTPLNIIQSQASLIRKEREQGIDQTDRRLDAIRSASQRLTTMFDKWLHNDALNETLEVLESRPLDLQPWLRTLVQTNPHLLLNHRVALDFDARVHSVMADEYHLGLALTNLIDNATKYSPEHTTITLQTRSKTGYAGIAVCDEGPGIPPDMHDKVFAEFFRLAPESQIRGVGLGLSIVKRIADAHGGNIQLTSTPGHGACFCIWLPLRPVEESR